MATRYNRFAARLVLVSGIVVAAPAIGQEASTFAVPLDHGNEITVTVRDLAAESAVDSPEHTTGSTVPSSEGASLPSGGWAYHLTVEPLKDPTETIYGRPLLYDECGDRLQVSSVDYAAEEGQLKLCGELSYEMWLCHMAKVPEFKGLRVTVRERIVGKVRVIHENGRLCTELTVTPSEDGANLSFKSAKTTLDAPARLKTLVAKEGLATAFESMLEERISGLFWSSEPAKESFLQMTGPDFHIDAAEFVAAEDGGFGLELSGN